jgi:hypothetical protein
MKGERYNDKIVGGDAGYVNSSVTGLCEPTVGASTSHNPSGIHGLLEGYMCFTFDLFMVSRAVHTHFLPEPK